MNIAVEKKIQSFLEKSASKLLPLMQADVPNKIHSLVALSLARIKTPPCREQVKIYFKNNPDEEDSIKAISLIGGEDAANLLIERIKSKTARNRDVIADELGNFKQPFIIENLKEFLCDEDRHVRYQAANSLFKIGGQSCALAMCKYISDPDEWISMTILKHLCRLKEHETIPFLAEHFARDSDIRRKAIMVSFLSRFKSITLVNIFDEGLKFGDARLKANSIEAIGELELPQREIKLRIAPFIKDPNNRIKANAILALAKSEPNLIQSEIEEMINSSDVQLRRSGAYILGQIPSKGNEDYARQLIEDPSDDVRKRMVLSLRNFSPEFAVSQLERTIFDRNNWNRKYSVDIAKEMPNFPKEPILKQFKSETSAGNLIACMSFFARYPDEEAVRLIKQRVKDKRRAVVCEVIRAIGAIKKIDGLLGIAPQIDQKDPFILKAFVTNLFSLGKIDVFESTLEKAAILKRPPMNDLYLPSIDGCLEILNQGDRIPIGLMNELSGNTSVPTTTIAPKEIVRPGSTLERKITAPPAGAEPSSPDKIEKETGLEELDLNFSSSEKALNSDLEQLSEPKVKIPKDFQLGVKFYNLGKYKRAKASFLAALSEKPNYSKTHFYLGLISAEEEDWQGTRDSLIRFLESEPDNTKALLTLGKAYKSLRDWTGLSHAMSELLKAGRELPSKVKMRTLRDFGMALIFLKKYEEAKISLEKAFKLDPGNSETNFYLAMGYFHLQNFIRAETLLTNLISQASDKDKFKNLAKSLLDKIKDNLSKGVPSVDQSPNLMGNSEQGNLSSKNSAEAKETLSQTKEEDLEKPPSSVGKIESTFWSFENDNPKPEKDGA